MPESLRRHGLLRVHPHCWMTLMSSRDDLIQLPYLRSWARSLWPVIVRRYSPGDAPAQIPVAVPLPPATGKHRLALQIPREWVVAHVEAMSAVVASAAAPASWRATLRAVASIGQRRGTAAHVFGSLLWQRLTGLQYLGPDSDLDLLWPVANSDQAQALARELAVIAAAAPMRLDGEFILPDGGGVNWREMAGSNAEVLVKTMHGAVLRPRIGLFDPDSAAA